MISEQYEKSAELRRASPITEAQTALSNAVGLSDRLCHIVDAMLGPVPEQAGKDASSEPYGHLQALSLDARTADRLVQRAHDALTRLEQALPESPNSAYPQAGEASGRTW